MSDDDYVNEIFSDDETYTQLCDVPTPGCRQSPSLSSQPGYVQPPPGTLLFVPTAEWDPNRLQYDPLRYLHYQLEWKLTLNNRQVAKETEQDLVIAPGGFWDAVLKLKLEDLVRKLQTKKLCEADATTIDMSVTERSEGNITKRFDETKVDWSVVERQLQSWSRFFRKGRKLKIKATFNYVESRTAGPAAQGPTTALLGERQVRRDAERAVFGRTAAWEQVFAVFSCPGAPCDRGPYCWQDPVSKKHYKLMGHQLRNIVKQVQTGEDISRHENMPKEIRDELYAEEQQSSSGKRKRVNSGSHIDGGAPAIHIHNVIPGQADTASASSSVRSTPEAMSWRSALEALGMRDDVAEEYFAWHGLRVRRQVLKDEYDRACDLALNRGLDLELIHDDQDGVYQFLIDHGIVDGAARRVVRDVEIFLGQRTCEGP